MSVLRDEVGLAVYSAVSATLSIPQDSLSDDQKIIDDLGAKSVNLVGIIAALEGKFDLEIPFMEFRRHKSIGQAIDYIVQLYES